MYKYGKLIFTAILLTGLLAISYGGCGGGSDDSGGGTTNPTNPPVTNPPATNPPPTNPPTTDMPDPGACEGDAFGEAATGVEGCITDFFVDTADSTGLSCFCNTSEAGDFIFTIPQSFLGIRTINITFPEPPEGELVITNFTFEWSSIGCNSIEVFTPPSFASPDPVSIGTLDNINETTPDQLTFTANVSEQFLTPLLGSSGQSVSCDFCSLTQLPACAPGL